MKTGDHLKIQRFGDSTMGITFEGEKTKPEPICFRVRLPFGEIVIDRCDDDSYWVHIRKYTADDLIVNDELQVGEFTDGRVDVAGKNTSECDHGDFKHPNTYHVAVRLGPIAAQEMIKGIGEEIGR